MNINLPYATIITKKLQEQLSPTHLTLVDESHKHAGHLGYKGDSAETHFALTIISNKFNNLSKVARHRLIYKILAHELKANVHALAIEAFAPEEKFNSDQPLD